MATVDIDIKKLLEAGAHFGHKTSRWHPKMAEYIHSKRNGGHIIDLTFTVTQLDLALNFIIETVAKGQQVLFVGTKRQAKDIIKSTAEELGMPYVTYRWLGGLLTNQKTISGRIKRLVELESKMASGELANRYNKLEVQRYAEEIERMNLNFGGIKEMTNLPGVVFITDIVTDINALKEAIKLGIPTIALVDTNADPSTVTYPVPCNDDSIKTIQLIADYLKAAVAEGSLRRKAIVEAPVETKTPETELAAVKADAKTKEKAEAPKKEAK